MWRPFPAGGTYQKATYTSDDLVLRIVDAYPLDLPLVTLYGDGRVITLAPAGGVGPSPALPRLRIRSVDSDSVCRLVQMAIDAGVGRASDEYGYPPIMDDVPVTQRTVRRPREPGPVRRCPDPRRGCG